MIDLICWLAIIACVVFGILHRKYQVFGAPLFGQYLWFATAALIFQLTSQSQWLANVLRTVYHF